MKYQVELSGISHDIYDFIVEFQLSPSSLFGL